MLTDSSVSFGASLAESMVMRSHSCTGAGRAAGPRPGCARRRPAPGHLARHPAPGGHPEPGAARRDSDVPDAAAALEIGTGVGFRAGERGARGGGHGSSALRHLPGACSPHIALSHGAARPLSDYFWKTKRMRRAGMCIDFPVAGPRGARNTRNTRSSHMAGRCCIVPPLVKREADELDSVWVIKTPGRRAGLGSCAVL